MSAKPRFAHVVYHTSQPEAMRDWYCKLLDAHVVYTDANLSFITFDDEHHRVALIHAPESEPKTPRTAAMHHTAYTFDTLDALLDRYVMLRDQGILPAVCIAHGVTTSMYYRDPDRNFVELQIDAFADPDEATDYMMNGEEYSADSVGPAYDPEEMLRLRREGASVEELSGRAWCVNAGLGNPMEVLMG